ncbi:DNA-3-methyladenine glycosylase [Vallicoccus soli]|uniref:DNA-3-methyladenine glycosylase n=1 Tax=Vallicoccus soli TaxID=2339232 RepID=UPI001C49968A|nr:DNA-3-methyladenine glycosylase [Vallicoccus soli]
MSLLDRSFFDRPVLDVAPDLLGRVVVHDGPQGRVAVRLTEVEAYDGEQDPGSHAFRGRTRRNATMYGPPGLVYVYFTYGMHWCMNLVCRPEGVAGAVLLRAGEVVEGVDLATARRTRGEVPVRPRELARGPARLCVALGVVGALDGSDAVDPASPLRVQEGAPGAGAVRTGPRVGVAGAGAPTPWRYWLDGEPTVSAYRAAVPRRRRPAAPGRIDP